MRAETGSHVRSLGEVIKDEELGGDSIVRLNLQSGLLDILGVDGGGSDEAPELALDEDGSGGQDTRAGLHSGGDTVELNTEALDLDLVIDSAQVDEGALVVPATQVASVEHHRAVVDEGVANIALGGLVGKIEVAPGDAGSSSPHNTCLTDGDRAQVLVEDVGVIVGSGSANGDHVAWGVELHRVGDSDLSRATGVPELEVRSPKVSSG